LKQKRALQLANSKSWAHFLHLGFLFSELLKYLIRNWQMFKTFKLDQIPSFLGAFTLPAEMDIFS